MGELLLPGDSMFGGNISNIKSSLTIDLTAIAPNATNIQGVNANSRLMQRRFMDSINNSGTGKCRFTYVNDLINFLARETEEDDNYVCAPDDEGRSEEDDGDEDDYFYISKPKSWCECITMLFSQNEDRLLMIQNPDGLLYLTFLK